MTGAGGTKTLARIFIDAKISVDKRGSIPVLAMGKHIIWIRAWTCKCCFLRDRGNKTHYYSAVSAQYPDEGERWSIMKEVIHEMYSKEQIDQMVTEIATRINKDYEESRSI